MNMQYPYKWLAMVLLLFIAVSGSAQKVAVISKTLDGSQGQLVNNAFINVYDAVFLDNTNPGKLSAAYSTKNIVTFRINEYSNKVLPDSFTAVANIRITYLRPDGQRDSITQKLKINYADSMAYTSRSTFVFNNSHDVTVRLLDLFISRDAATVKEALLIENEMDIQAVYNMTCTGDVVPSISYVPVANTDTTDELTVQWPEVTGADEYDLEWTFVDDSALVDNRYGNPLNATLLFRNNASRVTVKSGTYKIPLFFEGPGKVFFRVRAVQAKANNARLETTWTPANPSDASYVFSGHQRKLNWHANIAFAEEGKRNVTVEYYDGSLRNRQTVTKDNTTNTTIVGEKLYDYQGRPTIQVMAAPTLSSVIKYSRNFNQSTTGEYDKSNYDYLEKPEDFLTAGAAPMDSSSGANQYYSANNPLKDVGMNRFLPTANGYAFTETAYTQDGTGRISRQGGVGETFRLGSNHETKYYYASPNDNDLDVLFGTEAGDPTHYFKNAIEDANGQMSIAYVDMHGRTVATALAGRPDSAQLDDLESNTEFVVIDTLSRANSNVVRGNVLESSHTQLVTIDTTYSFHYAVLPPVIRKNICGKDSAICYPSIYDLEILITDDVNNQHIRNGKGFDTIISLFDPATISPVCSLDSLTCDFVLDLKKGSYQITKRLTINSAALAYYRDSIFMQHNTCKTLEEFIEEQRALLARTQCVPDCQSCRDSVGTWDTFRAKYMSKIGVAAADTASLRGEALASYNNAVEACAALCDTLSPIDEMKKGLLADMTAPSGQYANVEDSSYLYSIFYHKSTTVLAPYSRDTVTYLNEAGEVDQVFDEQSGQYILPNKLSPAAFAKNFKKSWANALLKFHPEYCRFQAYTKFEESLIYDSRMQATNTYAEAQSNGFLNPYDTTTIIFNRVTANRDPLSLHAGARTPLYKRLMNYNYGSKDTILSMYSVAAVLVHCTDATKSCASNYLTQSEAFDNSIMCDGDLDMTWRNFRTIYINYKKHLVDSLVQAASCPNTPTAKSLSDSGMTVHFPKEADAFAMGDISYTQGSTGAASDSVKQRMAASYAANCDSYISEWTAKLLACTNYNPAHVRDSIIPKLKAVCIAGSDETHILGSSTIKPGAGNQFSSFEAVIKDYNTRHGIPLNTNDEIINCSGVNLTIPAPYDKQRSWSDVETYAKPTACECDKLNLLYTEYDKKQIATDTTLAAYLNRTRGTSLTASQLDNISNACWGNTTCNYTTEPLVIPPLIQCNTAPACASCAEINALDATFKATYPTIKPTYDEQDSVQQAQNQFYAAYMNRATGYGKQAYEYLAFLDTCKNYPSAGTEQVCYDEDQPALNGIHLYTTNYDRTLFYDHLSTKDGGFLIAGIVNSNDAGLVKTDASGEVIWSRKYGKPGVHNSFKRVRATADGGYIAIGNTNYGGRMSLFIVKVDSIGKMQWSKSSQLGNEAKGTDILQTPDGGYVFTARRSPESSLVRGEIGALDSLGNIKWMRYHDGAGAETDGFSMILENDTLIVVGSVMDTVFIPNKPVANIFLNKLNVATGQLYSSKLYAKRTHPVTSESNYSNQIVKTDYGYLLDITAYGYYNLITTDSNIIMGINRNGDVLFAKQFGSYGSRNQAMQYMPFTPTADGGIMVSQSMYTPRYPQNVWSKLDQNNNLSWSNQPGVIQEAPMDIQNLTQLSNGSYAGSGTFADDYGMLILADDKGKLQCANNAVTNIMSNVTIDVTSNWVWAGNERDPEQEALIATDPGVVDARINTYHSPRGCTVNTCYSIYTGPLLCGNATPVFPTTTDTITNCTDDDFYAISVGTEQFKAYRDSLLTSFGSEYTDTALAGGKRELFTVTYVNSEYHYTLYYYDQAGNLVKTIPPAGVVVDRSPEWIQAVRSARALGQVKVPAHTMATQNRYNSLNQVVAQISPDKGISYMWFDRLGRLVFSQNAKQQLENKYTYTTYDELGRPTEVGEITSATPMTNFISRNEEQVSGWIAAADGSRKHINKTVYDIAYEASDLKLVQENLRNRISWRGVFDDVASMNTTNGMDYSSGTFYSYDIHGKIKSLMQDFKQGKMAVNGNRMKTVNYQYDLISGNINWVGYQPGNKDAFYHRYTYDAINRLIDVETSRDSVYWEKEAYYQYYKHGPLARKVIGQQQVQGVDFAYTLQEQLKGINSTALTPEFDMGADGASNSPVAKDAFGLGLHYYGERDYTPVKRTMTPFAVAQGIKPVFNGNIVALSQNIPSVGKSLEYAYTYDVLSRLKGMTAAKGLDSLTNSWSASFTVLPDFQESISYDPNGNILNYKRNGNESFAGGKLEMDNLDYHYRSGTNKLDYIMDKVPGLNYDIDIDSQLVGNYRYDSIGNLSYDRQGKIDKIEWNMNGQVERIYKNDNTIISYTYNVDGIRISKTVDSIQTWYIHDASGNVMSVYTAGDKSINKGDLTQTESHLYGSNRLGILSLATDMEDADTTTGTNLSGIGTGTKNTFVRGNKSFELTNHLGNVLATVSDKKVSISYNNSTIDHYEPLILSSQEYYPFGMLMPGRGTSLKLEQKELIIAPETDTNIESPYPETLNVSSRTGNQPAEYVATKEINFLPEFASGANDEFVAYIADGSNNSGGSSGGSESSSGTVVTRGYRYGLNGQEKSDEIAGKGNHTTAEFWEYDTRIGRRWNLDPRPVTGVSPYAAFSNRPIWLSDPKGDTVRGVTSKDAPYLVEDFQQALSSDNLSGARSLIRVAKDKKSLAPISRSDWENAFAGKELSPEEQGIADGIFNTINDKSVHWAEFKDVNEPVSKKGVDALQMPELKSSSRADIEGILMMFPGTEYKGLNAAVLVFLTKSNITMAVEGGTYSLISKKQLGFGNQGSDYFINGTKSHVRNPLQRATLHEIIGHGRSLVLGVEDQHSAAIRFENILLKGMGINFYRDGTNHGTKEPVENNAVVPEWLKISDN